MRERFALYERAIRSLWESDLLFMRELFALYERAIFPLWESDLLFMREQFALFKSRLCSLLKRKLKTRLKNLYHTFWFCCCKNQRRAWIALLALLKRAIHSFLSKNNRFAWGTKERIPNPASRHISPHLTGVAGGQTPWQSGLLSAWGCCTYHSNWVEKSL